MQLRLALLFLGSVISCRGGAKPCDWCGSAPGSQRPEATQAGDPVHIGYFIGGRTSVLYRAYLNGQFEARNSRVELISKGLHDGDRYSVVPKTFEEIKGRGYYGKATGDELIDLMDDGIVDGATIGETSFIKAVRAGRQMIAVAELGFDTADMPGHGIVLSNKTTSAGKMPDLASLTWGSRRSSGGDGVFLRAWLESEGVDLTKVKIIDGLKEDELKRRLTTGELDGAFYHLTSIMSEVGVDAVRLHRRFDWVNPEMSQAVLVFSPAYVKRHPDEIRKVLAGYLDRIGLEHAKPLEERRVIKAENAPLLRGLQSSVDYDGLDLPQYRSAPTVRIDLLDQMQALLVRYGLIDQQVDLAPAVDNSLIESVIASRK